MYGLFIGKYRCNLKVPCKIYSNSCRGLTCNYSTLAKKGRKAPFGDLKMSLMIETTNNFVLIRSNLLLFPEVSESEP